MIFPHGVPPNAWHKYKMKIISVDNCEEINFVKIWVTDSCPKSDDPVSILDCQDCDFGIKGNIREGKVYCSYDNMVHE